MLEECPRDEEICMEDKPAPTAYAATIITTLSSSLFFLYCFHHIVFASTTNVTTTLSIQLPPPLLPHCRADCRHSAVPAIKSLESRLTYGNGHCVVLLTSALSLGVIKMGTGEGERSRQQEPQTFSLTFTRSCWGREGWRWGVLLLKEREEKTCVHVCVCARARVWELWL